jgi:proton-conducting membrane transporter/LAGLIDADG DNA endonuclease family protein
LNIDYFTIFSLAPYLNQNIITLIGICLLIGAMAKSSQIGLHVWLPQAMEGPTPVSALIHAATMVTAGVYLLMRTSPLIEYSSTVLLLCLWIGAITTIFSSIIGLFQQDIKKVIAYSTMSQLAQDYNYDYLIVFRHQTICVKFIFNNLNKVISKNNSQITKAHGYYFNDHISINLFNSSITVQSLYLFILNSIIMSVRWKVNIISKLVEISEAIRLILIFYKSNIVYFIKNLYISILNINLFIFYIIIYTICYLIIFMYLVNFILLLCKFYYFSFKYNSNIFFSSFTTIQGTFDKKLNNNNKAFIEWLAGLIDGNGCFILTKKGYASCKITMDARDKKALDVIKHKYGGSIKQISNANAFRYKLRHKKGLIWLINDVNGNIRNPARLLQINKLCVKYDIVLKNPEPLTFNNGWLSGFIDSDGSIYYSESSGQVFISLTQKNKYLLDPLIALYGGRVDILSPKIDAFKYIIYRKLELFNLIDNYFNKYPLKTEKIKRLNLIKQFYELRVDKKNQDINKLNKWVLFKDKWEKYKD